MKIFSTLDEIEKIDNAKVALGAFDGIHLGHQKIISRVVEEARRDFGTSVVFTFENHPLSLVNGKKSPLKIVSAADKKRLIEKLGVDVLCNVPFTRELLEMSATDFISLMRQKFELRLIVVGENYRYGYRGEGTADNLKKAGEKYGFRVEASPLAEMTDPVTLTRMPISSSRIREFLKDGKISAAAFLLGRDFSISGEVVGGYQRGRKLGYPTANIALARELILPADGVYAAKISARGAVYNAVANIGSNPTFSSPTRGLEVHLLDFAGDLYGEIITTKFIWRIRSEMKFENAGELKAQIARDILEAQIILRSWPEKI